MKVSKILQLTENDWQGIRNTALYTNMIQRRYQLKCINAEESVQVWEEIANHCQSVWYIEKMMTYEEHYYVYFSTDFDARIMSG